MNELIAFTLFSIAGVLLCVMLWQALTRRTDLLSLRNFFLLGFILFQFTSAAVTLHSEQFPEFALKRLPGTGVVYFMVVSAALVAWWLAYSRGWIVVKLSRIVPIGEAAPGVTSLLTLAWVFLAIGIVFRLVLIHVPILGIITGITGAGLVAVAAGMAMWVWAPRLLNPFVAVMAGAIVLLALLTVLQNAFGRRDLLSVTLCAIWGAYHSHWKNLKPGAALLRLGALGAAGMVFLAAFTAVRSGRERDVSATEYAQRMQQANVQQGVMDLLSGQLAGLNSMWMIENFPDRFDYDPLHSLVYFAVQPVPRAFWPGKPEALGRTAVPLAKADKKKGKNYSIGPGLVGHIWHDNPWLAFLPYTIGLGLIIRFLDELVRRNAHNPFIVLPVGTALGQILGLARGELGLFLFQALTNIALAAFMMFVVARVMAMLGWRMRYDEPQQAGSDWPPHDGESPDDGADDQDHSALETAPAGLSRA